MASKNLVQPNQEIYIELENERKLRAILVSKNSYGIHVKKVEDLVTNILHESEQVYYNNEIKQYFALNDVDRKEAIDNSNISPIHSTIDTKSNIHDDNALNDNTFIECNYIDGIDLKKKLSINEKKCIDQRINNFQLISQFDAKYYDAINDLLQQEIISVISEHQFGRINVKRSILTLCTMNQIYIFDMIKLGKMQDNFKEIFQSEIPRKVCHKGAEFTDYLCHLENCQLNGVFDTLVLHFNLKKAHHVISVEEYINTYLEFPDDLQNLMPNPMYDYFKRPIDQDVLMYSALKAFLLLKLYMHMINDVLLSPIKLGSKTFSNTYENIDNIMDLYNLIDKKRYPEIKSIDINGTDRLSQLFKASIKLNNE